MKIGEAIDAIKEGKKVARKEWHEGDYVSLYTPEINEKNPDVLPYIEIKVDGKYFPWSATQPDILADDWCVLS